MTAPETLEQIAARLDTHILGTCECPNGAICEETLTLGIRAALRQQREAGRAEAQASARPTTDERQG